MVGSETKYPAWTHWVHFDYFLITFTIYPQFTHPNTHQVHVEYFQKVPSTEPTEGGFDLPAGFILINFTFCPQFAHPNTHWVNFGYFYKVPTVRAQFFAFQILTFDKSGFPRALIIAWKSHHSPYPLVLLPPLRLTHQDEHGQEQNKIDYIPELSEDNDNN